MYSKGFVKNHEFYDDFDKASVTNTEYTFYKLSNSRLTFKTLKSPNQQSKSATPLLSQVATLIVPPDYFTILTDYFVVSSL